MSVRTPNVSEIKGTKKVGLWLEGVTEVGGVNLDLPLQDFQKRLSK